MVKNIGKIGVVARRVDRSPDDNPQDVNQSEDDTPQDHHCSQHGRPFQCYIVIPEKALKGSAISHRAR